MKKIETPSREVLFPYPIYTPGVSALHTLDPRIKLALALAMIIGLPITGGGGLPSVMGACLLGAYFSGISPLSMARGMRSIFWLVLVVSLTTIFSTPGTPLETPVFLPVEISREGIERGALAACQLMLMFWLSALVTWTTSPRALLGALEKICFKRKGKAFPRRETLLVGLWAFQLVPLLLAKAEERLLRELSRRTDGNILEKTRNVGLALVPFVIDVFRDADKFAALMDLPVDS